MQFLNQHRYCMEHASNLALFFKFVYPLSVDNPQQLNWIILNTYVVLFTIS